MSYHCRDCSYTQQGRFPAGGCPACGSFNIQRQQADAPHRETQGGAKAWRLWLSATLWLVLAYLLYQKL